MQHERETIKFFVTLNEKAWDEITKLKNWTWMQFSIVKVYDIPLEWLNAFVSINLARRPRY